MKILTISDINNKNNIIRLDLYLEDAYYIIYIFDGDKLIDQHCCNIDNLKDIFLNLQKEYFGYIISYSDIPQIY